MISGKRRWLNIYNKTNKALCSERILYVSNISQSLKTEKSKKKNYGNKEICIRNISTHN